MPPRGFTSKSIPGFCGGSGRTHKPTRTGGTAGKKRFEPVEKGKDMLPEGRMKKRALYGQDVRTANAVKNIYSHKIIDMCRHGYLTLNVWYSSRSNFFIHILLLGQ